MSGSEAAALGIVNHCVPTLETLDEAVSGMAARIAQGGPRAIAATKDLLNELDGSLDESLLRRAAGLSASVLATRDAQERLRNRLGA